jgi:hypothetical protein
MLIALMDSETMTRWLLFMEYEPKTSFPKVITTHNFPVWGFGGGPIGLLENKPV